MIRTLFKATCTLLLALAAALPGAAASAASSDAAETARAGDLFREGKVAFVRGDFARAEALFSEAFALRKTADVAANLGQAQLEQQKWLPAAEHFTYALANLLPSATEAQRNAISAALAKARAEVGVLRLEIEPSGAEVLVGEQPLGPAPIPRPVFVAPGEVIVSAKHSGYISVERRVFVEKGSEQVVRVELAPKTSPSAPARASQATQAPSRAGGPPSRSTEPPSGAASGVRDSSQAQGSSLVPALVSSGVFVVAAGGGVFLTLSAAAKDEDADELLERVRSLGGCPDAGAPPCAELKSQREQVDTQRNLALGAFVVGGAAALASGYFWWQGLSQPSRESVSCGTCLKLFPKLQLHEHRPRASSGFMLDMQGRF
jgi:tetratricopeptide (TPR) repeat protein